jgi:hypothetical protein
MLSQRYALFATNYPFTYLHARYLLLLVFKPGLLVETYQNHWYHTYKCRPKIYSISVLQGAEQSLTSYSGALHIYDMSGVSYT